MVSLLQGRPRCDIPSYHMWPSWSIVSSLPCGLYVMPENSFPAPEGVKGSELHKSIFPAAHFFRTVYHGHTPPSFAQVAKAKCTDWGPYCLTFWRPKAKVKVPPGWFLMGPLCGS